MKIWLNYHLQAIKLVLARLLKNKLSTLMISLVIAVTLCVPGLFYMGVSHIAKLTQHIQSETEMSVFMKLDASHAAVAEVESALASNKSIKSIKLMPKDEAWQQLKDKADADSGAQDLDKNPLPDAFFIQAVSAEPAALESLKNELSQLANVEQVLLNTEWVKRLSALLALGKQIILLVASLLAVALLVIISNTVRMQIITQKDEIIVSKLIGATNSFIRKPFLYAGMLYGLLGGILAILMLITMVFIFNLSIAELSNLYHSDFSLPILNGPLFISIILAAIFIGWLGSYLAVTRAIAAIKIN